MAKRRRKRGKFAEWIASIIGLIVSLGIGGLFTAGGFLEVPILSLIPLIGHQIVGWIIIVGSILVFLMKRIK